MIERSLKQYLESDPAIMAIAAGIYAGRIPQDAKAKAAVVFYRVSADREYCLQSEHQLVHAVFGIWAIAKAEGAEMQVVNLFNAIDKALAIFHGDMKGTWVDSATLESESMPLPYDPIDASDDWTHRYWGNWRITYRRSEN